MLQKEITLEQPVAPKQLFLSLPGDVLKTPTTTYQPQYCAITLPDRLVESLQTQAQQDSTDARSLLLAAFHVLLYRYTQQETIDLELSVSGDTLNQACLTEICTPINGELSVRALIAQLSATLKTVQEPALLSPLQAHTPLAQRPHLPLAVTFIAASFLTEGTEQRLIDLPLQTSERCGNPDLHLVFLQQPHSLAGVLRYNASLFQPETIHRLVGHFQVLLNSMVDARDCSIAQLPLLTQAEAQQLAAWQSASALHPQVPIHQYIETHAVQQPDAIAVTFKDQQLTYAELNHRANQLAHYLKSVGVGAEVRVAVCVEPSLDIAVSLLGIFKAGGVYLPLDPTHPAERLTTILEEAQPNVLLTQSHLLESLPTFADQLLCLDQEWALLHQFPTHNPENEVRLDQTSHLVYTSGTTGKPKGVMTSHSNLVNYILVAQERFGFDRHDVIPAIARFTFSITMFELLSPLVAGGRLVILERDHILDFKRLTQTLAQLTVIHTSPSLLQKLLAYIQDNALDLKPFQRLRHVSAGGDMVPVSLLDTMKSVFQQAEIHVIYGCSEVSCMGCSYPVATDQPITKSRVGKPFPNVSVRLYDAHQNLVPIGVSGEIYIGGAGVTKGYLQREALTQEKFVTIDGDRFYRTGDLGRLDADGNLEMLGRSDFQIKLRGIRIELGEIEATLRQAPGVREGIVVMRELWTGEQGLVAYIVLNQAQTSTEPIRRFLQTKLPDYMIPTAFVVLEAMPVNINQKVDRRALPAPDFVRTDLDNAAYVAPRNPSERLLTDIWAKALGLKQVGIDDDFFALGGHSLLAVRLFGQIEKTFGKQLPLASLLKAPTVRQLAELLEESSPDWSPLVAIQTSGSKVPFFCVHGMDGNVLCFRSLSQYLGLDQPFYGLQSEGLDGKPLTLTRIEDIATYYVQAMRATQPEGPYYIGGFSSGGIIAFEMAQQLSTQGQKVALLVLLDSWLEQPPEKSKQSENRRSFHWKQPGKADLIDLLPRVGQRLDFEIGMRSDRVKRFIYKFRKKFKQSGLLSFLPRIWEYLDFEIGVWLDQIKRLMYKFYLMRGQVLPLALRSVYIRESTDQAVKSYVPKAYSGNVALICADDPTAGIQKESYQLLWGQLVLGELDIDQVSCKHNDLVEEPNVPILAEKIRFYLDQVEVRSHSL